MPAGLSSILAPTDRRLLWGAAACTLLLVAGIAWTGPPAEEPNPIPSVYSSSAGGARAAYLLLRELRFNVRVWEEPPAGLAAHAPGKLLILAEPTEIPSAAERLALREFADRGGRILFCGAAIASFFPRAKVAPPLPIRPWKEFSADLPSAISRGADKVTMRPDTYWGAPTAAQLRLYGGEDSAVVVSWSMGAGEVIWWAGATPMTNAGITQAGNLNLFLNSVSASADGGPAEIYWDEYFHGERTGLLRYIEKTPVPWAVAQTGLIALALLFTFSRRNGPIVPRGGVAFIAT